MFHYSLRVIDEPNMSEIRILNLCHKKTILVDIYRQSLLSNIMLQTSWNSKWCCEFYHPHSSLSCNKPVGWILTSDWIILHGLPRADKRGNLYRFCCKTVELLVNEYFCNLQQPHFLQDKSNSWVVKSA